MFATLLVGSTFDEVVVDDLLGAANGVLRIDVDLAARERHPALDLWGSSTAARENFLSDAELSAVKARRRDLEGDAHRDLEAAIEATN